VKDLSEIKNEKEIKRAHNKKVYRFLISYPIAQLHKNFIGFKRPEKNHKKRTQLCNTNLKKT
jgi:hypothetical protein